jgi:hypothetical protein
MDAINNEIKKRGRPFKMSKWIIKLEEVLSEENILFLSDHDLRFLVNERLEDKEQISKRTFENWKSGEFHPDDSTGQKFLKCIEGALIKQKQFLAKKMIEDDKNWQRFAWIMERKFDEWNLKKISERINKNETTNIIQITAGNEAQRLLIDNIINTDFVEVKPRAISSKYDNKIDDEYEF